MQKVAIDICGPVEKTENGNVDVITMQCTFSKYLIMVPTADATAGTVARHLINNLICIYGCPEILLSDLGSNFISKIFKEISKQFSIKKTYTASYCPGQMGL